MGLAAALGAGIGCAKEKTVPPAPASAVPAKEVTAPTAPAVTVLAEDATGPYLMKAINRGDAARVRAILARNAALVAYADKDGERPLTLACWLGNRDIVEALLGTGADINQRNKQGRTALHRSLECGHSEIAELLLARGAVLVEKGSLFDAAFQGDMARVRALVEADTDAVSAQEKQTGLTALMCAVVGEKRDVAEWLLQKGSLVDANDQFGLTPLYLAAHSMEMTELLLMWGAKFGAGGETVLHRAAFMGRKDVAELLIEKGAQVNAKTGIGRTPMHVVATKEVAELLIAQGAEVDAKTKDGDTPLLRAALDGHKEVAELLISKGARLDAKNDGGFTVLHGAAEWGWKDMAELLIAKGAQVEAKDKHFAWTPMHMAAWRGQKDTAELLLEKGAQINARTTYGMTPLGIAIQDGQPEMAEFLKSRGGTE
jgi:ankyrin repeat protein